MFKIQKKNTKEVKPAETRVEKKRHHISKKKFTHKGININFNKKEVLTLSVVAFSCFALSVMVVSFPKGIAEKDKAVPTSADGNWGLSFQNEGKAPVGNATPEYLAKYNAFYIAMQGEESKKKPIYLTFDCGYENGNGDKILDVLKKEKVPAAFFVVGNFVKDNPELIERMENEGHIVGNHTMHHPDMSAISDKSSFQKELNDLESEYEKITGKKMQKFYRPPQGKYSEKNLKQACDMGYTTVFWSLAYVDWLENDQPTREDALNLLNKRIHPGSIVLLHFTSKTNAEILEELIDGWKEQGYEFHKISELGTQKM